MSFAEQLSYLMESSGTKDGELAQYIGVSRQAIMGWKSGAMPALDKAAKVAEYFGTTLNDLVGMSSKQEVPETFIRIPVLGDVSAGSLEMSSLLNGRYLTISKDMLDGYPREECFALSVNGESMEPEFRDKSYVIVHQQQQCSDGDFVVVLDETTGLNAFKKYERHVDHIELVPLNSRYKRLVFRKQDVNRLVIQGVVINKIIPKKAVGQFYKKVDF